MLLVSFIHSLICHGWIDCYKTNWKVITGCAEGHVIVCVFCSQTCIWAIKVCMILVHSEFPTGSFQEEEEGAEEGSAPLSVWAYPSLNSPTTGHSHTYWQRWIFVEWSNSSPWCSFVYCLLWLWHKDLDSSVENKTRWLEIIKIETRYWLESARDVQRTPRDPVIFM